MHRQLTPRLAVGLAVALLGYFTPGIAWADLRFRALTDGNAYLAPLDDTPPGLPPAWHFDTATSGIDNFGDPTMAVTIDPITGLVRESYHEQNVEIREPLVTTGLDYNSLMTSRTTRRLWRDKFKQNRSISRNPGARQGGIFRIALPVQLPKAVRSIIGDGAPNLEVSGSETISLAGKSDWTANQSIYTNEAKRQGAFPSFEMKQELNVNLTGSIGDKIKVDVDQSSNVQTSLDNKVKLRYDGDEDDMVKTVELGNTNLSLQGASIRQEGLFGVKTALKLGNVDLVTIASKQEGKNETARFTPTGDKTHVIIRDLEYIKGQYFVIADHPANIDLAKLEVWKDDGNNTNNQIPVRPGYARLDPTQPQADSTNPQVLGHWDQLKPETEYTISLDYWRRDDGLMVPVLKLATTLGTNQMLAVSYPETSGGFKRPVGSALVDIGLQDASLGKNPDTLLLKMIRPSYDDLRTVTVASGSSKVGDFDPSSPWYPVLPYELRNFYDLQARNISKTTMSLVIRRLNGSEATPRDDIGGVPIIRILGLDKVTATNEVGNDGRVDDRYLDSERGILFFPDLNPFDPADPVAPVPQGQSCGPDSVGFLCLNNSRLNTLRLNPEPAQETANHNVYYRKVPDLATDSRYLIDAEVQSSRNGYFIGRFGILEGSEQVRVNNILRIRGTDYNIDYDTGQITFIGTHVPGPDDPITVDYSFAQGAGQVSRTLAGLSASYSPSADRSISSSFLYESKGAQEELVKLGEEPATSMIGDLSTVLSFRPVWMTQLTNSIPGIRTSTASALNLQGSVSTNIPNPNTKGEAYLDDMEGNRESNTLSLSRLQWIWSSVPFGMTAQLLDHSAIQWYNPANAVQEHDLKPALSDAEGGKSNHQVLELNFLPPPPDSIMDPADWSGVTQSLGTVGQDLTKVQYIEVWLNDFQKDHTQTRGKLHLDFGRIAEDAFWDRNNVPNLQLDTEDKNGNGILDRPVEADGKTPLPEFEDTGLDGKLDKDEPGYVANVTPDPNGDDYSYTSPSKDYSGINKTEGNGVEPESRPDTEDLNRNGRLDTENAYFETTIDLSDSRYVAIDVPQLYGDRQVVQDNPYNGWRLYRIPISDSTFARLGAGPAWDNVQAVRIWADGMYAATRFQIGGVELIGNRWLRQAFRDTLSNAVLEVQSRNNKDDLGIYTTPYPVKNAVGTSSDRREQSLSLKYGNLSPQDSVFAFKTYSDPGSGFGWALYQELKFYVHGDPGVEAQNLRAVARFGPDTLNFYEYSTPVKSGWQAISIPMERLSGLKEHRAGQQIVIDRETGAASNEVYAVYGNPSFTRIARVSFGLTVEGTPTAPASVEVWIDELRLSDVRKDRGLSSNMTVQANFADLLSLNGSYNQQDENYFRVGSGASQGTGFNHTAVGFSSTLNLDRFLPTSGVVLPVNVSVQHSTDAPKFRTGSDVILDAARSDVETREFNAQSVGVSYHRSSGKKGLARYTFDALSGEVRYSRQGSINPQSADSNWSFDSRVGYSLPIGGNGVRLAGLRVNPIPRTIQLQASWRSSRDVVYARTLSDTADFRENRSDVLQRVLVMSTESSFEPLSSVRLAYHLGSTRDMLQHQSGSFLGSNKGTEIAHDQNFNLNYKPRWLSLLQPDVTLAGAYREQASSERRDPGSANNLKDISNTGSVRTNLVLPLSRFRGRPGGARDTSAAFPLLAPFRYFFSKVEDVSASFDMQRSANLSRITGDPGKEFKSGFTQVFNEEAIDISPNSTFGSSRRYHAQGNTAFKPVDRLTFQIRGDYLLLFSDQLYGARRNATWSYPTVNATWSDLQRLLGLGGTLTTLTLTSGYDRQNTESGPKDGILEERTQVTRHSPLLSWVANFKNGIRLSASSSVEASETEDGRAIGYLLSRNTKSTRIELNKNFPASGGIRFPWSKKRLRLPNDLNLGATVDMGATRVVRHQPKSDLIDQDIANFRVGSTTSYNFSQSMAGGFNLEYRQDTNHQLGAQGVRRGITIEFNGTFRF